MESEFITTVAVISSVIAAPDDRAAAAAFGPGLILEDIAGKMPDILNDLALKSL